MPINSRQKGARAERAWRDELRAQGYLKARRGQQFSGSPDSPDVVCEELKQFHFEVKHVEKLNVYDAYAQAVRDSDGIRNNGCGIKLPIVAHKRNNHPWLVTMSSETFFKLLREAPNLNPELREKRDELRNAIVELEKVQTAGVHWRDIPDDAA